MSVDHNYDWVAQDFNIWCDHLKQDMFLCQPNEFKLFKHAYRIWTRHYIDDQIAILNDKIRLEELYHQRICICDDPQCNGIN
jgi:hypothetical protein